MALTEKGRVAVNYIKEYYPTGKFTAKDLSAAAGEKIVAATINGVVRNGLVKKIEGTSPVEYEAVNDFLELFETMIQEENSKGCTNTNLRKAAKVKNDEFYTRYEDIENEVMKYRKQFKDKIVYLPCDDPAEKKSEFWSFFVNNFDAFGLKKLIATHFDENGKAYKIWIDSDLNDDGCIDDADAFQEDLEGNGDFRSEECIDILKECDIVCTNPPFSLFKEFVPLIINKNKKFLIIGSQNAFTYKEIFPLIKNNIIWTGYNMVKKFYQPDNSIKEFGNVCWFTNLDSKKRNEEIVLVKTYSKNDFPTYDNYDAIEVDRVVNIPKDYDGVMGVPITFINKYNPNQFEIIDINPHFFTMIAEGKNKPDQLHLKNVGKKDPYARILIRKK